MVKEYYVIEIDRPFWINIKEVESLLEDGCSLAGGNYHPDSPEFAFYQEAEPPIVKRLTVKRAKALAKKMKLAKKEK